DGNSSAGLLRPNAANTFSLPNYRLAQLVGIHRGTILLGEFKLETRKINPLVVQAPILAVRPLNNQWGHCQQPGCFKQPGCLPLEKKWALHVCMDFISRNAKTDPDRVREKRAVLG